ncbi:hypothetical protein IQ07DRAFT_668890 [Pyrenochaeta sp. DS3sAY3a]|nr:hypothetical protein IQ07DRAFT_668890 [Pyrenochaeta sp. DS3sAY3a]
MQATIAFPNLSSSSASSLSASSSQTPTATIRPSYPKRFTFGVNKPRKNATVIADSNSTRLWHRQLRFHHSNGQ